jgi:hypothetical protein
MKDKYSIENIYLNRVLIQEAEDGDQIANQASDMVNDINATPTAGAEEVSPIDDPNFEDWEDLEDLADDGGTLNAIETFRDTDIPVWSYKTFQFYMDLAFEEQLQTGKGGLLIYGDPGLGKSEMVTSFARSKAGDMDREFEYINWHDASEEEKRTIIEQPAKYFVLLDLRIAQLEPTDFAGMPIPDFGAEKTPYVEAKPQDWAYLLTRPDAAGILFLDEINQGDDQTLKSLFQVVLDHKVGGKRMSKSVAVFGAGNLGAEFGNEPIPPALANRFEQGALVADPEGWIEYAERTGVNARIIAFVKSNPSENFYQKPANPDDPFPSPRQFVRLSKRMSQIQKKYSLAKRAGKRLPVPMYKALIDASAAFCGGAWARKFGVFLEHMREYDMKLITSDPEKYTKNQTPDKLYALTVFIANKLKYAAVQLERSGDKTSEPPPEVMEIIEGVAKVTMNVKEEFQATLWAMIAQSLTKEQKVLTLRLMTQGNYDPATKAGFTKILPKIRDFIKG